MARKKQVVPVLTDKMYRAVAEYFDNGYNKTQALLAAGYSPKTAKHAAYMIFNNPAVVAEIKRRQILLDSTSQLDKEWIVKRLMDLAESHKVINKYIEVDDDGALRWNFTGATEAELKYIRGLSLDFYTDGKGDFAREVKKFKIDNTNPLTVLKTLARIEGLFQDRLKLEGDDGVVEALQAARKRANRPASD